MAINPLTQPLGKGSWLLFSGLALLALAITGCFQGGDRASLDERALRLDRRLICPVCPGETIDQSQAELARQMRALVREKLAQGEPENQILAFFVDRYGLSVLAEPPKKGFNLMVWVIPPLALLGGGIATFLVVREMRKGGGSPSKESGELQEEALEPYLSLVDEEMKSLEPSKESKKDNSDAHSS